MLKDPLVWIDCEMTGLSTVDDCLIEVAVIVTDGQLQVADPGIDLVIKPQPQCLAQMSDFVRKMHTDSGLLAQLDQGVSLADAHEQVFSYIKRFVPSAGVALLAGNSVGTDKKFLEAQMPQVMEYLHYRIVDVSTVKEIAKRWYPRAYYNAPQKHGGHRALGDIRDSIDELKYYRQVLFPSGEGPGSEACAQVAAAIAAEKQW